MSDSFEQETAAYDCFTTIDDCTDSSDEESLPSTPRMSTAEQIGALYHKLQCMREEMDRFHRGYEFDAEDELSDNECANPTHVLAHEPYWDNEDGLHLEEDHPFGGRNDRANEVAREEKAYLIPPATCVIERMPPEIMMYIFELVVNADAGSSDDAEGFGGRRGWRTPVVLGHACSAWRTLVLRTASLWTSFSLVVEREPVAVEGLKASLDLWLQSSRMTEVAINLEVDPTCAGALDGELMDRLREMLRRCWRLRLNVSHDLLRGILQLQLPTLRTLEVRSSWLTTEVGGLKVRAPNLQTLVILGPTMVKFTEDALPWAQLREYRGVCWAEVQRHLDIVRLSPSLETCTLFPFYETKGTAVPIRLPRLRHLHVASYLGTSMGGFLRCLEVPALEELILEIPEESPAYGNSVWPKNSVLDLLARSRARLDKLELIGMDDELL
jgi:hypothetical protein